MFYGTGICADYSVALAKVLMALGDFQTVLRYCEIYLKCWGIEWQTEEVRKGNTKLIHDQIDILFADMQFPLNFV